MDRGDTIIMMLRTYRHMGLTMIAASALAIGCGDDAGGLIPGSDGGGIPLPPGFEEVAEACGIDVNCEGDGIAEGNASISGVASVDTFFQSVINFQTRADMVASGIDAEITAIGAAFGIEGDVAAGLEAKISANLEGGIEVVTEPARCQVDAQASVQAAAKCEGEATPPMAMVDCHGSCEVEASADVSCSAGAELKCTVTAPSVECEGECKGTCTVEGSAAADCSGTCKGTCDGECSLMNTQGQCAGKCEGTCEGSCDVQLEASAECTGTCKGECTVTNPEGGCEGGIRASCEAQGSAMVKCEGRCSGEVTPPMASVECEATAKAEASMNVECSPPRVALEYRFAADVDAEARAEFEAGLRVLEARLPALLASIRKAEFVVGAGADLTASAEGAVKAAVGEIEAGANFRILAGLNCALGELDEVGSTLQESSGRLQGSLMDAGDLTGALGMGG
jgi:modification target Cys-rich repeat protein